MGLEPIADPADCGRYIGRCPVGKAVIGDHGTESGGLFRFIFGGHFHPVLAVQAQDQATLVVLFLRLERDAGCEADISGDFCEQAVAIIRLKAVMGALPKIRLGICF